MFVYVLLALAFAATIELITRADLWAAWLLGVNATTAIAFSFDKQAAERRHWRVPERVLHTLAALGGSPAAFAGRSVLRHKTRDERFRRVLFAIGGAHLCMLLGVAVWVLS